MLTLAFSTLWVKGTSFEKIRYAHNHRFQAIEGIRWNEESLKNVKEELDRNEVALSAIFFTSTDENSKKLLAWNHGIVHEDARQIFVDTLKENIEAAKVLGTQNIIVTTGNEAHDIIREKQHENIVKTLKKASPYLEDAGVRIVFEPLNTIVNHKGYFLTSTAEAVEIATEVDSPNVLILFDIYHQQITEGNLIHNITNNIAHIGHFHIADVPGRKQPGTGEINYKNVFNAIKNTNYHGYAAFECLIAEGADPAVVCAEMLTLV